MSNSSRNIDYFMTSLDLAHRIGSVELLMARSGLTPQYVSNFLEPVDPRLCELVCGNTH